MQPNDDHVDFSDLPSLPPEQIRVLSHIIRNPDIRLSDLISAFDAAEDGESITPEEITKILGTLEKKQLLNTAHHDGEIAYRARMRRKTPRATTIQSIWNVLDSGIDGEALESGMNREMRRARSELANSLLADMSKEDQFNYNPPPADPELAKQTGQALLNDLMNTGRSSMSKREGIRDQPDKKPEARGRILQDDIAGRKSDEAQSEEEEESPVWHRLRGWLGLD